MDLAYWGFAHWPFQRHRVNSASAIGASQEEALARLLFMVDERRRCGLLTGIAGTGKSCLFRIVSEYARRQGHLSVDVIAGGMDSNELVSQIADQLGVEGTSDSPSQIWSGIQRQLRNRTLVQQAIVLLIDGPDVDRGECESVLRRLLSIADSVDAQLTILLASRTSARCADLIDQMELRVELTGWSHEETAQFISSALRVAGAKQRIFHDEAVAVIHDVTQGLPADVTRVCDFALLAAMGDDRREVDADLIHAVMAELSPPPSHSIRSAKPVSTRELQRAPR